MSAQPVPLPEVNDGGELIAAAICFAKATDPLMLDPAETTCALWPWDDQSKPDPNSDPIENLVKARDLLNREIERLLIERAVEVERVRSGGAVVIPLASRPVAGRCERCDVAFALAGDLKGRLCRWCIEDLDGQPWD